MVDFPILSWLALRMHQYLIKIDSKDILFKLTLTISVRNLNSTSKANHYHLYNNFFKMYTLSGARVLP